MIVLVLLQWMALMAWGEEAASVDSQPSKYCLHNALAEGRSDAFGYCSVSTQLDALDARLSAVETAGTTHAALLKTHGAHGDKATFFHTTTPDAAYAELLSVAVAQFSGGSVHDLGLDPMIEAHLKDSSKHAVSRATVDDDRSLGAAFAAAASWGFRLELEASFETAAPTIQPTVQPTEQPTEQPTLKPTQQPTEQPTVQPSVQPTDQPTVCSEVSEEKSCSTAGCQVTFTTSHNTAIYVKGDFNLDHEKVTIYLDGSAAYVCNGGNRDCGDWYPCGAVGAGTIRVQGSNSVDSSGGCNPWLEVKAVRQC